MDLLMQHRRLHQYLLLKRKLPMQVKLKERSLLQSGGPLHETCAAYIDLLGQLEKQSYAVQAAAFWLVEYVYNRVRP